MSTRGEKWNAVHNGFEIKAGFGNHLKSGLTGLYAIVASCPLTLFSCILITQISVLRRWWPRDPSCFIVLCFLSLLSSDSDPIISRGIPVLSFHTELNDLAEWMTEMCSYSKVLVLATVILFVRSVSRAWGERWTIWWLSGSTAALLRGFERWWNRYFYYLVCNYSIYVILLSMKSSISEDTKTRLGRTASWIYSTT